jgi:RHS repeat-associated protein
VGSATPTYDANGNLTKDERGYQCSYDAWNRLVQVKDASNNVLATYKYDGLGRRIQETEGGTTTDLYYNAAWQVVEERVSGAARVQYVWSAAGTDVLVERDRDPTGGGTLSERLYVQQDANGNVTALVNTSGQVVERYVYDPFGAVTVLTASWAVQSSSQYAWRYLFQGSRYDWTTGLANERNREYDPAEMRWLQNDPSGFGGGDTNLYRALSDSPAANSDPSGLTDAPGRSSGTMARPPGAAGLPQQWPVGNPAFEFSTRNGGALPQLYYMARAYPDSERGYWARTALEYLAGDSTLTMADVNRVLGPVPGGGGGATSVWGVLRSIDALAAGHSDGVTAGLTTWLREGLYGDTVLHSHQSRAFAGARVAGVVTSVVVNPCSIGRGAIRTAARGQLALEALGHTRNAIENYENGNYWGMAFDLAGASFAMARFRVCFTAGTPVLAPANVGAAVVDERSDDAHDPVAGLAIAAVVALALGGWVYLEQRTRDTEEDEEAGGQRDDRTKIARRRRTIPEGTGAMAPPLWKPEPLAIPGPGAMVPACSGPSRPTAATDTRGTAPAPSAEAGHDTTAAVGALPRRAPRPRPRLGKLCLGGLLLVAGALFAGQLPEPAPETAQPTPAPALVQEWPIERLRVGERVWTRHPDVGGIAGTSVDPRTWRKLTLRALERWDDGTLDDINVETLQPPEWLRAHGAAVGATVPLPLDLAEMGLPEHLRATVLANEPCPPLTEGPGRLVLTTVNHLNADVRELTVEDGTGRKEPIRPTGLHKFYREGDARWVSAHDLAQGDRLRGWAGPLVVVGNRQLPGTQRVYNLTIEGEHVYHVSTLGVVAHNNCQTSAVPDSYINSRYTISMVGAPARSATNAAGFARNGPWFWRQMLKQHPELFSDANAALIRRGRAPVIDATWVAGNPTHQSFLGDTLIHHHIGQGGIATALPQRVHRAWHSILHPD